MFCQKCGQEMPNDAILCVKCGTLLEGAKIETKIPDENAENKFCRFCGKQLNGNAVVCTGCGRPTNFNITTKNNAIHDNEATTINENLLPLKKDNISINWILNAIALICIGAVVICGISSSLTLYYMFENPFAFLTLIKLPVIFGYVFSGCSLICQITSLICIKHAKSSDIKHTIIILVFALLCFVLVAIMTVGMVQVEEYLE